MFGTREDLIREIYPVTGVIAHGHGCFEVIRTAKQKFQDRRPRRERIMELSKQSLVRLMFLMQCTDTEFKSMFTATYPSVYPKDGKMVKRDVNYLCQTLRRKNARYLWFLEFQERGAPHIHFLLDFEGITPAMRANLGLLWTERIANSEWFTLAHPIYEDYRREIIKMASVNTHPSAWEYLRDREGAKRYVTKYAAKALQKEVPVEFRNVGRFWGASRGVRSEGVKLDVTEDDLQQFLFRHDHPMQSKKLVPKYLWQVGTLTQQQLDKKQN